MNCCMKLIRALLILIVLAYLPFPLLLKIVVYLILVTVGQPILGLIDALPQNLYSKGWIDVLSIMTGVLLTLFLMFTTCRFYIALVIMHQFFYLLMALFVNIDFKKKIENWWLKEQDFNSYAKNSWHLLAPGSFFNRNKQLSAKLKIWCRKKKPLQEELKELEGKIKEIQTQPLREQNHVLESKLIERYEQNITKLNDFYLQRAKKNWIKDGDRNTTFFSSINS